MSLLVSRETSIIDRVLAYPQGEACESQAGGGKDCQQQRQKSGEARISKRFSHAKDMLCESDVLTSLFFSLYL